MKKKLFILIPLIVVVSVALLWQPVVTYYMNRCLTGYCREYLKGDLKFQEISRKNGKWVIDDILIDTEHRKIKAEQVSVDLALSPFSREVDLNIVIKNPQIDFEKKTSELQAFLIDCLPLNLSNWAFKVNSSIFVEEGLITWHPISEEDTVKQSATFRLKGVCKGDELDGKLVLEVEEGNKETNIFEMTVSKKMENSLIAELNFQEVDCAPFCEAAKGFGFSFREWNITDGIINGKVTVNFEGEKRPQIMGKAVLQGLVFDHPDFKTRGDIQEARLDIRAENLKDGHLGIVGKVEITEDASVVLLNEDVPYWEIQRLKGGIYFQGKDLAIVDIEGRCTHRDSTFGLNIEGDVRFPDPYQSSIDIAIELISPDENIASARFAARQLGTMHNSAEIELKNIGKEEFSFVQTALSRYFPVWKNLEMLNGGIDASGTVFMQKYRVTEVNIDNIAAHRLKFEILPIETKIELGNASGALSMSMLKEDLLETINAQILVEGGSLKYQTPEEDIWEFTNISTDFRVNDGVIQKSILKGGFAGLKGTVELDWLSDDEVMKASFNGQTQGIIQILPEYFKQGLDKSFLNDHLTLFANVKKNSHGLKVDGVVSIVSGVADNVDTISFGAELEKGPHQILPASSADRLKAIKELIPHISSPKELIVEQVTNPKVAGFRLRNGWFTAHHIPLNKYLTPFLFPSEEMEISGNGDFSGYMDLNQLAIEYEGRNLGLESPSFVMQLKQISKVEHPVTGKIQEAIHFFDFSQGTSFGFIPLRDASYTDKNLGLNFTHINADILCQGRQIQIAEAKANMDGTSITADIDIDLGLPDSGKLNIDVKQATFSTGDMNYLAEGKVHYDPESPGEFDFRISESNNELARIAGKIGGRESKVFDFDNQLTHFGSMNPNNLRFIITKENDDIEIDMNLAYEKFNLVSHIFPRNGKFYFDKTLLVHDRMFSMQLDGEILVAEKAIQANAKNIILNFKAMEEVEKFQAFSKKWKPQGILTGAGKIRFSLKESDLGLSTEAILNTSLDNWSVKGFTFADAQNVSCHFISDKGVTFRNIITGAKSEEDASVYGNIKIDMTRYGFEDGIYDLEGMRFEFPAENLELLAYNLEESFSEKILPPVAKSISEAKTTGIMSGILNMNCSPIASKIKLALDNGSYQFMGAEHLLSDFLMEVDDSSIKMTSNYLYENHPFTFEAFSTSPNLAYGDLVLKGIGDSRERLDISWNKDETNGFVINHAKGEFSGLQIDLVLDETGHDSAEEFMLKGTVKVNDGSFSNLLPQEVREKFAGWLVGAGYLFKGNWTILRDLTSSGKVKFNGWFLGKDFEIGGYQFETLASKLEYTPNSISITDLKISDEAVAVAAEVIDMGLDEENRWNFSVPDALVTKFRPSGLCPAGSARSVHLRPLVVKELQIKDFQGIISDPKTYTGDGQLTFTNKSKNPVQNTIFDVPAEILARIGLDMALMTPVNGSISYDISDGYIHLKKFKDMFSERKLSKFYLSDNHNSTIDFNGNLDLQIRMKQYNLLFKLTEPFAVNIHGKYTNPTYRLNAENKKSQ